MVADLKQYLIFLFCKRVILSGIYSLTCLVYFGKELFQHAEHSYATNWLSKPNHKRRVSVEIKQDIQVLLVLLKNFN